MILSHSSAAENLGGAELSLLHLIDRWRQLRDDVEFHVVAKAPEGLLQPELARRGVRVTSIRYDAWVLPRVRTIPEHVIEIMELNSSAMLEIEAIISAEQPDVVLTNTIVAPWAAIPASHLGVPHVWFVHEYGDLDHGLQFTIGRDETFDDIGLMSGLVVVNSHAVRHHIERWIDPKKITLAYPVIDTTAVLQGREIAPDDAPVPEVDSSIALNTVMVGRITPSKGQWRLVQAIAELAREGRVVTATFVGDANTPDAHEVIELAERLGVRRNVVFVGETENPFWYVARADIGVTASDNEAFGRVTVEYMALGRPVVASQTGAGAELIDDGETGWLFDPNDPESLLVALRAADDDRAEVRRRGENASERAESIVNKYPIEPVIEAIEALVASGHSGMERLPNVLRRYWDIPAAVEAIQHKAWVRNQEVLASFTMRFGQAMTRTLTPGRGAGPERGS